MGQNDIGQEISKGKNYEQTIKNWKKSADCLNENNHNAFEKMIEDGYFKYSKSATSNKKEEFDQCLTQSLLMALTRYQQKQINNIKEKQHEIVEILPH